MWSELPLNQRQEIWLERRKLKREEAKKLEVENAKKEVILAPNITAAQTSWEHAKRVHEREAMRQKAEEEARVRILEMKQELKRLRLEERLSKLNEANTAMKAATSAGTKKYIIKHKKQK
eukprot:CAMPEP_0182431700 /NCGR_PEP_ID=MMETSP1167-20130531/51016_1 /TAXON_ID=2988 /ORGANISM="Mallomonas Sp, Strain CCMP3275" /LENGTH=119 /DNA_ID=CAMNT_0024618329 /DNA_START=57 /DNA_END=413 /DNA_ORIENTATION=+